MRDCFKRIDPSSFALQDFDQILLAQLAQLCNKERISLYKLIGETFLNCILLLKDANDGANLLPQGEALRKALIKVLNLDAELIVDAAICADIKTRAQQHGLHKQACLKGIVFLECNALHGFLKLDCFNVTAIFTQLSIHDGLEHEVHLAFES